MREPIGRDALECRNPVGVTVERAHALGRVETPQLHDLVGGAQG